MGDEADSERATSQIARRVRRGSRVGGLAAKQAARIAATSAASHFRTPEETDAARDRLVLKFADDLVSVVGGMRGAAHKMGQVLAVMDVGIATESTREEFARRLEPLFSSTPPWSDDRMRRIVDRSLGVHRDDLVELSGPIAAASIGQVYRGRLVDGRDVAVKVKYPDIDMMVKADLKNLTLLSKVLARYVPATNVDEIVGEVVRRVRAELDFGAEAAAQKAFAERFRGHPAIVVPDVMTGLCTDQMLVTEFVEGVSFDEACATRGADDRDFIGEVVYRFYCGEMYGTGRFSADPHPGNMLVLPDARVAFLDYGLTVELTPTELEVELAVFGSLLNGDDEEVYRLVREAGFIVDPDATSAARFAEYARGAVGWQLTPGVTTITPRIARRATAAALSPLGQGHAGTGRQAMVEGHGFGRRNELATCALLGRLGATAPWSGIAREVLGLGGPATSLGLAIAEWSDSGTR